MTKIGDPVKSGDFCKIVGDHLEENGLPDGTEVMVASVLALPISEEDPYLQRVFAFVNPFKEKELQIPTNEGERKNLVVDPRSLKHVNKRTRNKLSGWLENQFGGKDG